MPPTDPAEPSRSDPRRPAGASFQAPRGTRDFYPIEMARRLWLEDKWRKVAVRHGFDEIDGPTFEHLDLYTVKSGEGIVSELFSFTRAGGETALALRPEFTPTLARMAAARANALPKPVKWFSIGPYFRAERPQRGRLREFLQWNVDVLGDASVEADAEAIACCVEALREMGLTDEGWTPTDVTKHPPCVVRVNSRRVVARVLQVAGVADDQIVPAMTLLDRRAKTDNLSFVAECNHVGLNVGRYDELCAEVYKAVYYNKRSDRRTESYAAIQADFKEEIEYLYNLVDLLGQSQQAHVVQFDPSIVRGLAYYTGTVFEVHEASGAERAIAGGGRYDNLVELFGGPPTPAVGFAMGDVVVSLVLQDRGLMPTDEAIARELGLAPDAFVVCASDEAEALALRPVLAHLRREGLHARRSYKATRNVGKLLQEADKAGARYAVILESATRAQVKDLRDKSQVEAAASDAAGLAGAIRALVAPPSQK